MAVLITPKPIAVTLRGLWCTVSAPRGSTHDAMAGDALTARQTPWGCRAQHVQLYIVHCMFHPSAVVSSEE